MADDDGWRKLQELFEKALAACGPNARQMAEYVSKDIGSIDEATRLDLEEKFRRMLSFQEPPAKPDFEH